MNAKYFLVISTMVFSSLLAWQLRWVILIIFGAIVLSVAFDVLIVKIQSIVPIARSFALTVAIFLLISGGSLIYFLLAPELISQANELGTLFPNLIAKLKSILSSEPRLQNIQDFIPDKFSWDGLQPIGESLIGFAGGAANSIVQLLLISLLAILLALDPTSHRKILIYATPKPGRSIVEELLDKCRASLGGWLTGMTISALSVFLMTWAGLLLLGVPLALLSALICGLLTFVPTIGPITATLLPLGVAILISPTLTIEVLILRLAIQNIEAFILTPFLLKRTVNLLPTVAITSQLSLGALLGLPGVLIALPLAVVLQVIIQRVIVLEIFDKW